MKSLGKRKKIIQKWLTVWLIRWLWVFWCRKSFFSRILESCDASEVLWKSSAKFVRRFEKSIFKEKNLMSLWQKYLNCFRRFWKVCEMREQLFFYDNVIYDFVKKSQRMNIAFKWKKSYFFLSLNNREDLFRCKTDFLDIMNEEIGKRIESLSCEK